MNYFLSRSLLLSCTLLASAIQADHCLFTQISPKAQVVCGLLTFGLGRLFTKETKADFAYTGDVKQVASNPFTNPKKYLRNLWDLIDSRVIGQPFKDKNIKLTDDHKLQVHDKVCPPAGLLGHGVGYLDIIADKVSKTATSLVLTYAALTHGGFAELLDRKNHNGRILPKPGDDKCLPPVAVVASA